MTNKLFIVKYVFVNIDIEIMRKNSNINNDKRENFDNINFKTNFARNIYFFNILKNVVNKVNTIKINKMNLIKIFDEIKSEINDQIKVCLKNTCENVFDAIDKTSLLNINFVSFVANLF